MTNNVTRQNLIKEARENLAELAKRAQEQGASQKIAMQITGQGYAPEKVILVLKSLHNINYSKLIGRTTSPQVISFLLAQKGVAQSSQAKQALKDAVKRGDIASVNAFTTNGIQIDTVKVAIDAHKTDIALDLVKNDTSVTTDHFLSVNIKDDLAGHLKIKSSSEQHLETTIKLFATKKTDTTLPTMKQMFDSFICNENFNQTELPTTQELWLEIGKKVLCTTTDSFVPTAAPIEACTTQKSYSSHARDVEMACLSRNEIMGITDNSNCEGL